MMKGAKEYLEEALVSVTMSYLNDETPFNEWYAAIKNSESDELRGLIAHLIGTIKGLTSK